MTNHIKAILGAVALVGATTIVTTQVVSQQPGQEMPDAAAMMQEWMKLGKPGKEHRRMQKMAGLWTQTSKHWMSPGAEPEVSTSVARYRPILGGRFLLEETFGSMSMMGEDHAFEAFGILGYDNYKKKHMFAWVDSMGTMMMYAEGTADETGDVITYFTEMPDPMTGATLRIKAVSRVLGDDENVFRMYIRQPDDTWFRTAEVTGTRSD